MLTLRTALCAATVAATSLASPVLGQTDDSGSATAPDAASVQEAQQLLEKVAKTYREAPAITDQLSITATTPQGQQTSTMTFAAGKGGSMEAFDGTFRMVVVDDVLYIESQAITRKYLRAAIEQSVTQTLMNLADGNESAMPLHFLLRTGLDPEQHADALALHQVPQARITGLETVQRNGETFKAVNVSGQNSNAAVVIDPETTLIEAIDVDLTVPNFGDVTLNVDFEPQIRDALEEPIAFKPDGREAVSTMEELQKVEMVKTGDTAPTFTLKSADGETVSLDSLRGKVVVLDFWATWCGPCIRGLPKIQQLSQWIGSNGLDATVYTIDVWENHPAAELPRITKQVFEEHNLTLPILLDATGAVANAYGFQSIPTTVVVDPQGRIHAIHQGLPQLEALKQDVQEALEVQG